LLSAAGSLALLGGPLVSGASAQPSNDAVPVISGNGWVGQTLSLQQGTWEASPQLSDQWQDCNSSGDVCAPIQNATGLAYTVATSDLGYKIEVAETATAPDSGTATADSNLTATIAPPSNQSPPAISGTPAQGQTLTASTGAWTNDPTSYAYQWEDCNVVGGCTPIPGATQQSYTAGPGDVGSTFVVQETAFDASTASTPADSSPTDVIQTGSSVQLVSSHSTAVVKQTVVLAATVTAAANGASPEGSMTFTSGGVAIAGCSGMAVNGAGQSQTVLCEASFPAGQAHLAAVFNPGSGAVVLGSTSPTVTLRVWRAPTHIALSVAKQVMAGTRVTYGASVSVTAHGGQTAQPTGFVEFLDHGTPIPACTRQRIIKLAATCLVTYVLPGAHVITAGYRGDSNFTPVTSSGSGLNVTPIPVKGEIASTLEWTFFFSPSYTEVIGLTLSGVPAGASVQLGCHGPGCPFSTRREPLPRAPACHSSSPAVCPVSSLSLTSGLAGRRFGVGAQITLMIGHANYVGKYYSFTVRARAQPRVRIACLAPDSPVPGVACSFGQTARGAG
jgi:Bacterial Ig-like domain (group 3)